MRTGSAVCPECEAEPSTNDTECDRCGARRPQAGWPVDDLLGKRVANRFLIRRVLGRGGFGAVYEATHETLGGRRAVKVLRTDLSNNPEALDRFKREAEVLYRLQAPQLVKVDDFGCLADGRPFMVMEHASGERLDLLIEKAGQLPVIRCIRIAREVMLALAEAHDHGILHRDLKTENIIVQAEPTFGERVKVLDLGISYIVGTTDRLTRDTRTVGTPEYMAPEQWRGADDIDGRADLFALGVLMYEMLTGQVPFERDGSGVTVIYQRLLKERPRPISGHRKDLPTGLDGFILRLLAVDRDMRPATVDDALGELQSIRDRMRD